MHPDLRYHLDKLSPEYRALLELMIMQNQSDKNEQSNLQRDILNEIALISKRYDELSSRLSSLEKAKLVVTTVLWVLGGISSLLFASNAPSIVRFFLSL